jgi:hypothetical protein
MPAMLPAKPGLGGSSDSLAFRRVISRHESGIRLTVRMSAFHPLRTLASRQTRYRRPSS